VHGVEAGLRQRVVRLLRESGVLVHVRGVWSDLVLGQLAYGLAQHHVLIGEPVHVERGVAHEVDPRTSE
jgi:hypothetical protein